MKIGASWVDFKLGGRMLVKYPGLTLIGGLTLAVAIGVGAVWFEVTRQILNPRLPLPGRHAALPGPRRGRGHTDTRSRRRARRICDVCARIKKAHIGKGAGDPPLFVCVSFCYAFASWLRC